MLVRVSSQATSYVKVVFLSEGPTFGNNKKPFLTDRITFLSFFQNWRSYSYIPYILDYIKFVLYNVSMQTSQTQKTKIQIFIRIMEFMKVLQTGQKYLNKTYEK